MPRLVCDISQNHFLVYFYQQNLNSTKLPEKGIKVFAAFLHTHLQGLFKMFIANIIVFLILITVFNWMSKVSRNYFGCGFGLPANRLKLL